MHKITASLALITLLFMASGCVNRTISHEPSQRGMSKKNKNYGATGRGKVVEEKRVWIWQKEFRNY